MANGEQLKVLERGVKGWNRWRQENPGVKIDLRSAKLPKAVLAEANFSGAKLYGAYLRDAILQGSNLHGAALANANLRRVDLRSANLQEADLSGADFRGADLRGANLRGSHLHTAQLLGTNLAGAVLTGACIQDWHITSATCLNDIQCDYVFRKWDETNKAFIERLPVDPNSTFAPGEFTQRFQILATAQETIDLTFTDGIDWQAFFNSLQELRHQRPDENITVQSMESKGSAFIVRLEVDNDTDKAGIETAIKIRYEHQLALQEAEYRKQLSAKDEEIIQLYRQQKKHDLQQNTDMMKITQQLASRPITMEINAVAGDQITQSAGRDMIGNVGKGDRNQIHITPNASDAPKDEEARQLLSQLRQLIETANLPQDTQAEALDYLQSAQREAQKPEPKRERIQVNLESTTETLEQASKTLDSGVELWGKAQPILIKLAGWVGAALGSISF
jgi:PBP1b-binding outer membrane lipoprotein LpoB